MNHIRPDGTINYTPKQTERGTGPTFNSIAQKTLAARAVRDVSYADCMDIVAKTKAYRLAMGFLPSMSEEADDGRR
jgi:hypothetical protein